MTESDDGVVRPEGAERREFLKKMAAAGVITAAAVVGFTIDDGPDTAGAGPGQWIYTPPTTPSVEDTTEPTATPTPTPGPAVLSDSDTAKKTATKFTG